MGACFKEKLLKICQAPKILTLILSREIPDKPDYCNHAPKFCSTLYMVMHFTFARRKVIHLSKKKIAMNPMTFRWCIASIFSPVNTNQNSFPVTFSRFRYRTSTSPTFLWITWKAKDRKAIHFPGCFCSNSSWISMKLGGNLSPEKK